MARGTRPHIRDLPVPSPQNRSGRCRRSTPIRASATNALRAMRTAPSAPARARPLSGGSRLLAVGLDPRVDQGDLGVDRRVAQALLPGDELHQLVGALDVGGAILQR